MTQAIIVQRDNKLIVVAEGSGLLSSLVAQAQDAVSVIKIDGLNNTAVGTGSGEALSTGNSNSLFGFYAGQSLTTGQYNEFMGLTAGRFKTTSSDLIAIGFEALGAVVGGGTSVAVGNYALKNFAAADAVGIGHMSLTSATGQRVTAIGAYSGGGHTSGTGCTYAGWDAGGAGASGGITNLATGLNMTCVGQSARSAASNRVVLGNTAVEDVHMGAIRMFGGVLSARSYYGGNAGNRNTNNNGSVGFGDSALVSASGATNATAIGDLAMQFHVSGNGCTALGARAMWKSTGCVDTTMVGNRAGAEMLTGVGSTAVGLRVMEFATASRNVTAVGDSAFWIHQGSGGVAVGYRTAEYTGIGDESIYIGRATGVNRADGDKCVFVGAEAGGFDTAVIVLDGSGNYVSGAVIAGDNVVGIGYRAASLFTGDNLVAVGHLSARSVTSGGTSVFLGSNSGNHASQKVDAVNSTAIGADSYTDKNNQVVLGASTVTETIIRGVQRGTTFTVAGLPSAVTMGAGARAFVTDATATTFASLVAGVGANNVPVYSDGAAWRIG